MAWPFTKIAKAICAWAMGPYGPGPIWAGAHMGPGPYGPGPGRGPSVLVLKPQKIGILNNITSDLVRFCRILSDLVIFGPYGTRTISESICDSLGLGLPPRHVASHQGNVLFVKFQTLQDTSSHGTSSHGTSSHGALAMVPQVMVPRVMIPVVMVPLVVVPCNVRSKVPGKVPGQAPCQSPGQVSCQVSGKAPRARI